MCFCNKIFINYFLGSDDLDQVLRVLLGTAMFVGGVLGFILDNAVPGKIELSGTNHSFVYI